MKNSFVTDHLKSLNIYINVTQKNQYFHNNVALHKSVKITYTHVKTQINKRKNHRGIGNRNTGGLEGSKLILIWIWIWNNSGDLRYGISQTPERKSRNHYDFLFPLFIFCGTLIWFTKKKKNYIYNASYSIVTTFQILNTIFLPIKSI